MTLATAHVAAISGNDFDTNIYLESRNASLRALSHNMSSNIICGERRSSGLAHKIVEECSTEVAAGIISLCYGDLFVKHTTEQAIHLQACRVVIDTGMIVRGQTGHLNDTLQFLVREATELETTAKVFSFHDTEGPAPSTLSASRTSFWTFTGFIQEVTAAERELYAARQSEERCRATDVEGWISRLDSARRSIHAESWSGFVCAKTPQGESTLKKVININYLACLVYIHQAISPAKADDLGLRSRISCLMDDLQSLCSDPDSFNLFAHDVYWPLFIAGTICSLDKVRQAAVTHMFMQSITKTGHWCNYDALHFLQAFWEAATVDPEYHQGDWLAFARTRHYTAPSFIVF